MSDCIRSIRNSLHTIENYCIETVQIYKHQVSPKQREIVVKTAMVAIATLCLGAPLIGGLGFVFSGFSTLAAFIKITRAAGRVLRPGAGNAAEQPPAFPVIEPVSIRAAKGSPLAFSGTTSSNSTPTPPSTVSGPVEPIMLSRWIPPVEEKKPLASTLSGKTPAKLNESVSPSVRPVSASTAPSGSMAASVGIYASAVFKDWVVLPNGGSQGSGGN